MVDLSMYDDDETLFVFTLAALAHWRTRDLKRLLDLEGIKPADKYGDSVRIGDLRDKGFISEKKRA